MHRRAVSSRCFKAGAPAPRTPAPLLLRPCSATATAEAPTSSQHSQAPSRPAPAFKAAIDFKGLKENLDAAVKNVQERKANADPQRTVQLYDDYVKLKGDVDGLRAERNANAAQMKVRSHAHHRCPHLTVPSHTQHTEHHRHLDTILTIQWPHSKRCRACPPKDTNTGTAGRAQAPSACRQ